MPVTSATSAAQNNAAAASAANEGAVSKLNADFDMFLKLLTAQMKNQDPLDPLDTNEYTQQLVQYSQVEQSIAQTGLLKDILARFNNATVTDNAALVGKTAEIEGSSASIVDGSASWRWSAEQAVEGGTAHITDATGIQVTTVALNGLDGVVSVPESQLSGFNGPYNISIIGENGDTVTTYGRTQIEGVSLTDGVSTAQTPIGAVEVEKIRSIYGAGGAPAE